MVSVWCYVDVSSLISISQHLKMKRLSRCWCENDLFSCRESNLEVEVWTIHHQLILFSLLLADPANRWMGFCKTFVLLTSPKSWADTGPGGQPTPHPTRINWSSRAESNLSTAYCWLDRFNHVQIPPNRVKLLRLRGSELGTVKIRLAVSRLAVSGL